VEIENAFNGPSFERADVALNLFLRWSIFVVYMALGLTGVMPVNLLALGGAGLWFAIANSLSSYFWIRRRPMDWYDSQYLYLDFLTVVFCTLSTGTLIYPTWMAFVLLMIQAPAERPTAPALLFNMICVGGYAICAAIMYAAGWYSVNVGVAVATVAILMFIGLNMAITFDSNRRLHHVIRSMAVTDSLTGLANRRNLSNLLANPPTDASLAVILMDVDRFKLYNDTYGHLAGDNLLARLARELERMFPDATMIARYGGDEFVVLLPCETMDVAEERVRTMLNDRTQHNPISVTAGVALWPEQHPTLDATFEAADDCLRAAKRSHGGGYTAWSAEVRLRA
jgi:diguanylate cyclase (GGDEF)-like protein